MAKRKTIKIYDATTNTIYESISAASKALGIDAANIRKVINGQRISAGGHNFISAGTDSKRQLRSKAKKLISGLSSAQITRQALARGEDPELISIRQELFQTIKSANKRLSDMKKLKVLEFSAHARQVLNFTQKLGANSKGLLDGSMKNLEKLNKAELNAINNAIKARLEYSSFSARFALGESDRIGRILGLDAAYARKYRKMLPMLWDVLKSVREHGKDSDIVVEHVRDMMESGKTVKYIQRYLETEQAYQKTRDEVFDLFTVAQSKWRWLEKDTEADSAIIKLVKLQSIYPDNESLNIAVSDITNLLKRSRTKKAVADASKEIVAKANAGIFAAQLTAGEDYSSDVDSIITYFDVLELLD